ncbi:MAG: hypothetical protein RL441_364 [Actinomycetota bacterium]|jgi:N-acetyl-gamma-glutamyl-phosphate reductase
MSISVAIAGGSGYAGGELLRLLAFHPEFSVKTVAAASKAGTAIRTVHPHLTAWRDEMFVETDAAQLAGHDLVFLAMPHGASADIAAKIEGSARIVDLGADFRLAAADQWTKYYGSKIPHAGTWQYGLPELVGAQNVAQATRVANPGCYATAIALGAAPAVAQSLIDASDIVVLAASGTSGAGRSASETLLATEIMGSITSYKTGGVHQHTPEIEQTLSTLNGSDVRICFTPLLAPMSRGIHATVTAKLADGIDASRLRAAFVEQYANSAFVLVLPEGEQPRTANVIGTNHVQLQVMVDEHTRRMVTTVVIDNLVKGAAGQAIQNANLMFGFDQSTGLDQMGVAP